MQQTAAHAASTEAEPTQVNYTISPSTDVSKKFTW